MVKYRQSEKYLNSPGGELPTTVNAGTLRFGRLKKTNWIRKCRHCRAAGRCKRRTFKNTRQHLKEENGLLLLDPRAFCSNVWIAVIVCYPRARLIIGNSPALITTPF